MLSLNRRRGGPDSNRVQAAGSRSGKNIVENLYMLTNNVPQYSDHYIRPQHPSDHYDEVYSAKEKKYHYDQDRYERIGERRP